MLHFWGKLKLSATIEKHFHEWQNWHNSFLPRTNQYFANIQKYMYFFSIIRNENSFKFAYSTDGGTSVTDRKLFPWLSMKPKDYLIASRFRPINSYKMK